MFRWFSVRKIQDWIFAVFAKDELVSSFEVKGCHLEFYRLDAGRGIWRLPRNLPINTLIAGI